MLTGIIVKKLNDQGVDSSPHREFIKRSVSQFLGSSRPNDSLFELKLDDGRAADIPIQVKLESSDVDKAVDEISSAIEAAASEIITSFSDGALKNVLAAPSARLLDLANDRDGFVRRLALTWSEAFKLLDIHLALCNEIGAERNDWLRKKRARSKDMIVVDVIARLHGRAASVAAEVQGNPNPNFANIEAAVDFRFRPYFRLASNTLHAGAKGTFFRLGILGDHDAILVGPSNVGLEEAGRLAAFSLTQITTVLLGLHANTDSIVWGRVLLTLTSKIEQRFIKIKRRIQREERQLRKT